MVHATQRQTDRMRREAVAVLKDKIVESLRAYRAASVVGPHMAATRSRLFALLARLDKLEEEDDR
jgi:hypothetical protein